MPPLLSCVIVGPCRTKKNHTRNFVVNGVARVVSSKAYLAYEKVAIPQLRIAWAGRAPLDRPMNLSALIYRDRDTGDLVGYLQALCDILEKAGVVEDDRLIMGFDGSRLRLDRVHPETALVLAPLDE